MHPGRWCFCTFQAVRRKLAEVKSAKLLVDLSSVPLLRPWLLLLLLATACSSAPVHSYTLGGTVVGLTGTLVLETNGAAPLTISQSGPFTFANTFGNQANYAVVIASQPTNVQCTISNGTGVINGADFTGIAINCVVYITEYSVNVMVTGLSGNLTLTDNGNDTLQITQDGNYAFAGLLTKNQGYNIAIVDQPGPQQCTIAPYNYGVITIDDVTLTVSCINGYQIGGTVSGISQNGIIPVSIAVTVTGDPGATYTIQGSGNFVIPQPFVPESSYTALVEQFNGVSCYVLNADGGEVTRSSIQALTITCTAFNSTDESAISVLGQTTMSGAVCNQGGLVNANTLCIPMGNSAIQQQGLSFSLLVPDSGNNRVGIYGYDTAFVPQGVIGQGSFTTNANAVGPAGLNGPTSTAVDSNTEAAIVADTNNSRLLVYNPTVSATTAVYAVGQANFTTTATGCDANSLNHPQDVIVAQNKVFVADTGNNRVLVWDHVPGLALNGNGNIIDPPKLAANQVIGQPNFKTCTAGTLNHPTGVWSDGQRLYVVNQGASSVLMWNSWQLTNLAPITLSQFNLGNSTTQLNSPTYVASDGGILAVSDTGNNRVLIWSTIPTTSNTLPDTVIGQSSFLATGFSSASSTTLSSPAGLTFFGLNIDSVVLEGLLVGDTGNNRVLVYLRPTSAQP